MFRKKRQPDNRTPLRAAAATASFSDPNDAFWAVLGNALVFVPVSYDGASAFRYHIREAHGEPTVAVAEDLDLLGIVKPFRPVRLRVSQLVRELEPGHAVALHLEADMTVVLPAVSIDWFRTTLTGHPSRRRSESQD